MKAVSMISKPLMTLNRKLPVLALAVMSCVLFACRDTEVAEPSFEVHASATTVNVGDSINFKFTGNPDLITFYSGEPDKEYKFRKRVLIENGSTTLNFSTTNAVRTTQADGFKVFVSTDHTGVNTPAAVAAATWEPLDVNLSTSATEVGSGSINLNNYVLPTEIDKPLFVAFKYKVAAAAGQGTWVVKSFNIQNETPSRTFNLVDISTAGWMATNVANNSLNWVITPIDLTITGRGSGWVATEDWVITEPIYINRKAPDTGLTIKDTSSPVNDFHYAFTNPGTYTVTFVSANSNVKNLKETVKEITIQVN